MVQFKLTLKKSTIGRLEAHKQSVKGLGLRKINHSVVVNGTPENMGMINQVRYLLSVEEC
jgi:large subunit ribosomal protein L30